MPKNSDTKPKPKEDIGLEIFFDRKQGNYWLRYPGDSEFMQLDWSDVKTHLKWNRVKVECSWDVGEKGDDFDYGVKVADKIKINLQRERAVDHAGPFAGYKVGAFTNTDGRRILVTAEPKMIVPKMGPCPFLEGYINTLFAGSRDEFPKNDPMTADRKRWGYDQVLYFMLWVKHALESLHARNFAPAPLLVLAGEPGCGKSFMHFLLTRLLGGRAAKPWRYMTGATDFNGDLAFAEHLYIEDEAGATDIGSRRKLGDAIKQITVVEEWSIHDKGQKAFPMRTFKRASMSINHEPEKMAVLPPLDSDIKDKISLLRCYNAQGALCVDRLENQRKLEKELPAFAALCLAQKSPKSGPVRTHPRYGVAAYHHPELLELVVGLTPETRLLDFIDEVLENSFVGQASELERLLMKNEETRWQLTRLLTHSSSLGTFLSRLAQQFPDRFSSTRSNGKTKWSVKVNPDKLNEK